MTTERAQGAQQDDPPVAGNKAQPDLTLPQRRVTELWSFMIQDQKLKALPYVVENGQEYFLNWNWPPVKAFAVQQILLGDDPSTVEVRVRADVIYAGFGEDLQWPVDQEWVFREGNWFLVVKRPRPEVIFGGGRSPTGISGRRAQKWKGPEGLERL